MPRRARGDNGGGNERGRDDGGGGRHRGDVGDGDVGGNRSGKVVEGFFHAEGERDGVINSDGDSRDGAEVGVVLLRQVVQKIRVDVVLRKNSIANSFEAEFCPSGKYTWYRMKRVSNPYVLIVIMISQAELGCARD